MNWEIFYFLKNVFCWWNDSSLICSISTCISNRFQDSTLREPAGLALDFEDNIYICDCKSNTVFQVTADGSQGRIIRSARVCVGSPIGIGFDRSGWRLWLTSNIRRSGQLLTMFYLMNWSKRRGSCTIISVAFYDFQTFDFIEVQIIYHINSFHIILYDN
jgi:hypothetical protein